MIKFKGSQKAFFKAYPKDRRSFDEVYRLTSYNLITKQVTEQCYKFIGTLGEKNFKKVETHIEPEMEAPPEPETPSVCNDIEARLSRLEDKLSSLSDENARLEKELKRTKDRLQEQLYDFGALCALVYIIDRYLNELRNGNSYDLGKKFFDTGCFPYLFHRMLQVPFDRTYMDMKEKFITWLKRKGMFNENNWVLSGKNRDPDPWDTYDKR